MLTSEGSTKLFPSSEALREHTRAAVPNKKPTYEVQTKVAGIEELGNQEQVSLRTW
jgi:hypothetical protein